LSNPKSSGNGDGSILKEQCRKEIYRCLFTILNEAIQVFLEFVVMNSFRKGNDSLVGFIFPVKKWGIELPKNRDRLGENMKRSDSCGSYHTLLELGGTND
jgi:hypothetical protein